MAKTNRRRRGIPVFLIGVVAAVSGVAATIGYDIYADRQAKASAHAAFEKLDQHYKSWTVTFEIATSTPRLSMSGPVADLAKIEEAVKTVGANGCVKQAADHMSSAMEMSRVALLAFMQNNPGAELIIGDAARFRSGKMQEYREERSRCQADPLKRSKQLVAASEHQN